MEQFKPIEQPPISSEFMQILRPLLESRKYSADDIKTAFNEIKDSLFGLLKGTIKIPPHNLEQLFSIIERYVQNFTGEYTTLPPNEAFIFALFNLLQGSGINLRDLGDDVIEWRSYLENKQNYLRGRL